ncbi:hypothetical protein [Rhizobium sp. BR 249]|uniref:hypothetical protein n=1 Tax=Rhizobium sp. BR 249 TaxID=3040011 RepID=UPI0039BFF593
MAGRGLEMGKRGAGDPNEAIIELASDCQFDPLGWSLSAWDWGIGALEGHAGPRAWQRDIFTVVRDHLADPATRFQPLQIAVASGHGIGKSAFMGRGARAQKQQMAENAEMAAKMAPAAKSGADAAAVLASAGENPNGAALLQQLGLG